MHFGGALRYSQWGAGPLTDSRALRGAIAVPVSLCQTPQLELKVDRVIKAPPPTAPYALPGRA